MHYSPQILRLARERYESQADAPLSPGAMKADAPQLCLASVLAWAGLAERDRSAADSFARELAASGDKSALERTFESLGWGAAECRVKLQKNDGAPADSRREFVLASLLDAPDRAT